MSEHHHPDRGPGSHRQFFTNWKDYDAPLGPKLLLTVRNRFVAIGLLKGCCGHAGEPGC